MISNIETKIRLLISAHHKLAALVAFFNIQQEQSPGTTTPEMNAYISQVKVLLEGIECLLSLVSGEERYIIELHLIDGMKWNSVKIEYEKRWPYEKGLDPRTYQLRQQRAIRKMCHYIKRYEDRFDFSWLDAPIVSEINKK